jgi:hypothetical protein
MEKIGTDPRLRKGELQKKAPEWSGHEQVSRSIP